MATPALAAAARLDPGSSSDLDAVMRVMTAAFGTAYGEAWTRSQCAGILPMSGVTLVMARTDADEVIGFSLSRCIAGDAELLLLAVQPNQHRRGVGRLLLDEFVDSAHTAGAERIHLEVRDGNPAVEMYRQSGFEPIGRRRNYYRGDDGRRFDAVTMARTV